LFTLYLLDSRRPPSVVARDDRGFKRRAVSRENRGNHAKKSEIF